MIETSYDMTIRRLVEADAATLAELAQRDSAAIPHGTVIGAFDGDGAILAALSLEGGDLVADPFVATDHAAALLRVRADQMRDERERSPRFRRRRSRHRLVPRLTG